MSTTVQRVTAEAAPKICAMTYAGLGAVAIAVHVVHEVVAEQTWAAAPVAAVTLALSILWPVIGRVPRRAAAAVLGVLWVAAASAGHLVAVFDGTAAGIDHTGLLVIAGGLLLGVAAIADVRHPVVWERGQR